MFFFNSLFSRWTMVAGLMLIGGAAAWAIKLGVIIATNGAVITTGAAALFMKIGLLLLLVGSTGIGTRIAQNRAVLLRAIAILLSPVFVFGLIFLAGSLITPLFQNSSVWYAQQEAPIGVAVLVTLAIGLVLVRSAQHRANSRVAA